MFLQSDARLCTVWLKFVSRDVRQMSPRVEQTGAPQARSEGSAAGAEDGSAAALAEGSAAGAEEGSQGQARSAQPLDR
jgi:hypothetical protein